MVSSDRKARDWSLGGDGSEGVLAGSVASAGLEEERKMVNSLYCSCQILLISISFPSWTSVNPSASLSGFSLFSDSSRAFLGWVGSSCEAARLFLGVNMDPGTGPTSRGKPCATFCLIQAVADAEREVGVAEREVGVDFGVDPCEAATLELESKRVLNGGATGGVVSLGG